MDIYACARCESEKFKKQVPPLKRVTETQSRKDEDDTAQRDIAKAIATMARQRNELLNLNANLEKDYRESEQERDRLKIRCNELATEVRVSSEALEKAKAECDDAYKNKEAIHVQLIQMTADRDAARLQAERLLDAGKWIPISTPPTESDGIVFGHDMNGPKRCLFLCEAQAWTWPWNDFDSQTTHWCRLPALPKGEKKDSEFEEWWHGWSVDGKLYGQESKTAAHAAWRASH